MSDTPTLLRLEPYEGEELPAWHIVDLPLNEESMKAAGIAGQPIVASHPRGQITARCGRQLKWRDPIYVGGIAWKGIGARFAYGYDPKEPPDSHTCKDCLKKHQA